MSRQIDSHGSPKAHGSCGAEPITEWLRQNGCSAPNSVQRASSSGVVSPKKPPTSTPQKATPDSPRFCSCGIDIHRCSHQDELSPVHCMAWRWSPAKPARVITNGRRSGRARTSPSCAARAIWDP